eukprot:g9165.t1
MIPKPGRSEKRALGIQILRDRAKQALVLMALEPQWEARFEPNSYGFRPGRSTHDAVEAVFSSIRVSDHSFHEKFVVDADLKGCFDNIYHNYLISKLDTLVSIRSQVKAWLKAGVLLIFTWRSSKILFGSPQGWLFPFLCNVALHRYGNNLKDWLM